MVKAAVVGLGYMGANHLRVLSQLDGVELAGICDADPKKKALADRYHCKFYHDYKELYAKEKPECVVIAVPTVAHKEVATFFIEKKVPVLLEKPVAASVSESRDIQKAAEKHGTLVVIGHIERFNPAIRHLKKMISDGALDQIFLINAERVGPLPVRIQDVGVIIDLAVHDIDMFQYVLGKKIKGVYASVRGVSRKDVEDFGEAIFTFEDGTNAHLRVNWLTPTKIRKLKVFGKKGMAEVDYIGQELYYYENIVVPETVDSQFLNFGVVEGEMRRPKVNKEEPLKAEISHFIKCVQGKEKPIISIDEAISALQVAEAMKKSSKEGKVISVG